MFNRLWPDLLFKASHCLCELASSVKPFFIHLSSLVLWRCWQSQRNCVFSFECKQTPFRWWKCATRHSFSFLFSLWSIALSILLIINALSCAVYKLLMNERVDWAQQMQKAKWDWRRHLGQGLNNFLLACATRVCHVNRARPIQEIIKNGSSRK